MRTPSLLPAILVNVAFARHFSPVSDISSQSADRSGRYLFFGNGTAIVNSTTVAVSAGFASLIGLGLMSVFHDAALKRGASSTTTATATATAAPEEEEEESGGTAKSDLTPLEIAAFAAYQQEVEEYERQYDQYLQEYAAWAEVFGQDPTPPVERGHSVKRRTR